MKYTRLGRSGLQVSRICLGTMSYGSSSWRPWVLDEAEARPFYAKAWDAGINFFDTADLYSVGVSEEVTGRLLRELAPRDELVIATKGYYAMKPGVNARGLSRKHLFDAVDGSLTRLKTDYIDLYQIHRFDPNTPIEETLEALHDLVKSGKIRYIGASSMLAYQFARMLYTADLHGWTRFVSMQNHYNLIYREEERDMLPLCLEEGVGVIPWSPLARGFLSGNRHRDRAETTRARVDAWAKELYFADNDYEVLARVVELAGRRGVTPAQIALAWLLAQPGVTAPVTGITKLPQLEEAVAAVDLALDPSELASLEECYRPHPIAGIDSPLPKP